jgi:hypothetical protein
MKKITVEIPDQLLARVKAIARTEDSELRDLMAEGLRRVLLDRESRRPYVMADRSRGGSGLQPEFQNATWREIRAASYQD